MKVMAGKKILALIMVLAMMLSMTSVAFAADVVTTVSMDGPSTVTRPTSGTNTFIFTANVLDDVGANMAGENVIWDISDAGSGTADITIDSVTGELSIPSSVTATGVRVTATSETNPLVSDSAVIIIDIAEETTVTISGGENSVTRETGTTTKDLAAFTAVVKDQAGKIMPDAVVQWTVFGVAGVSIAQTGVVTVEGEDTSHANGVASVRAQYNDIDSNILNIAVNYTQVPTSMLPISSDGVGDKIVNKAGRQSSIYTTTATDQYDEIISSGITWSVTGDADVVVSDNSVGQVEVSTGSVAAGSVILTATLGGLTQNITLIVEQPTVNTITVSGESAITIPLTDSINGTYIASAVDQDGDSISGSYTYDIAEGIVNGVTLNSSTGELTVASTASAGTITIVAEETGSGVTGNLVVTLTATEVTPVVTDVVITGANTLESALFGDITSTYTAVVKDQLNADMPAETVTWALQAPVTGVQVNPITGEVTLSDTAVAGSFTLVATSSTDPLVKATKVVTITKEEEQTYTVTFTVEDSEGVPITDATVTFNGIPNVAGDYIFENIPAGLSDYAVVKEGYVSVTGTNINLTEDMTIPVVLTAIPKETYTITFDIVDESSAPITDAVVTFDGIANAPGDYTVEGVEAGSYNYTITKGGYISIVVNNYEVTGDVTITKTLTVPTPDTTYTVTFNLSGCENHPPHAIITLNGVTNEIDDYDFSGIEAGTYAYTITAEDYVTVTGTLTVSDNMIVPIELEEELPLFPFEVNTTYSGALTANTTLTVNTTAINRLEVDKNVVLVVALYNADGDLVDVEYSTVNVAVATSEILTASLTLPANVNGFTVKTFVWEGTSINDASAVLSPANILIEE